MSNEEWTPVSKGLPKEHVCKDGFIDPSDHVLVQMKSGAMYVTRYWGSRESYKDKPWIDLSYPTTETVVAWRPLPKPYKEEPGEDTVENVIRIPEDEYSYMINHTCRGTDKDELLYMLLYEQVKAGAVLPKEHGKIVDIDNILKRLHSQVTKGMDMVKVLKLLCDLIDDAPAVIGG